MLQIMILVKHMLRRKSNVRGIIINNDFLYMFYFLMPNITLVL